MTPPFDRRAPEPAPGHPPFVGDTAPPLTEERRLTTSAWSISHALEFVAALAVGQGLLAVMGAAGGRVLDDLFRAIARTLGPQAAAAGRGLFVVSLITLPYVVLWVLVMRSAKRRHLSLAQLTGMRMPPIGTTVALIVLYTTAVLVVSGTWGAVLTALDVRMPNPTFDIARQLRTSPFTLALIGLVSVTIGPFVEELVFRGIVLPSFRRRFGTTWAIVGSSLLFAAIHFQPLATPVFFAVGLVLAFIYVQTRSLWAAVALHCTYNLVVAALVWTVVSGGPG